MTSGAFVAGGGAGAWLGAGAEADAVASETAELLPLGTPAGATPAEAQPVKPVNRTTAKS